MSQPGSSSKILGFGLGPLVEKLARESLANAQLESHPLALETIFETDFAPAALIFCGNPGEQTPLAEAAQLLRAKFPQNAIFYLATDRKGFDRKLLIKNGFNDAFLLPLDQDILSEQVLVELSKFSSAPQLTFKGVQLVDITPDTVMDFDTFIWMPLNSKYVRFSSAGNTLERDRAERLQNHQVTTVHIRRDQIKNFYQFTAEQLRKIGSSESISTTEKRDRMQTAVRNLLGGVFTDSSEVNFEQGRSVAEDCTEIVKTYIMDGSDGQNSWYQKILKATSGGGAYSHVSNVSTFSAMFSLGLGIGNPEELALAGLLHDIGLADLDPEILRKPEASRSPAETEKFQRHPELSIEIIKKRRIMVSENVLRIIAQHHERFNGKGYPKGLAGPRVQKEAQILAIADQFDYLIQERRGQLRLTPLQAVQSIMKSSLGNPHGPDFDPSLLESLLKIFPVSAKAA